MIFLLVGLRIALGGISQGFAKSVTDTLPRAKSIFLQYGIALAAVLFGGFALGQIQFTQILLLVLCVGVIDAFGVYARWQAYRFSLSKTTLMIPFEGVAAALLAAIFLGEAELYRNPLFVAGILLLFGSAFLLSRKKAEGIEILSFRWLLAVAAMIALFGTTTFALKYFAASDIPFFSFFAFWYGGAALGTTLLIWTERKDTRSIIQRGSWKVGIISLANLAGIGAQFFAFKSAPAAVVLPPIVFGGLALPLLIGWVVFREWKGISRFELFGFAFGILGAILLAITRFS